MAIQFLLPCIIILYGAVPTITGSKLQCSVYTRLKTLQDVGIADQRKAGKLGRDESIKQFSTQLHPIHIFFAKQGVLFIMKTLENER